MKAYIYHGNIDDFDRGPKVVKFTLRFENIAYSMIIKKWGVEFWRVRRGELFYDTKYIGF